MLLYFENKVQDTGLDTVGFKYNQISAIQELTEFFGRDFSNEVSLWSEFIV